MLCKNCNIEIPDNAKFCMHCGTNVNDKENNDIGKSIDNFQTTEQKKYWECPKCGVRVSNALSRCSDCGAAKDFQPTTDKNDGFPIRIQQTKEFLLMGVEKLKELSSKTKYILATCIVCFLLLGIILVVVNSRPKLVGRWENNQGIGVLFTKDGRFFADGDDESVSGSYEFKDSMLILFADNEALYYRYDLDGDVLMLNMDGETQIYYRRN